MMGDVGHEDQKYILRYDNIGPDIGTAIDPKSPVSVGWMSGRIS